MIAGESNLPTDAPSMEQDAMEVESMSPEKEEELKLRQKHPHLKGGPSQFLQKRLQQRKFFDSGDYNMAKSKGLKLPPVLAKAPAAPSQAPAVPGIQASQAIPAESAEPAAAAAPQLPTPVNETCEVLSVICAEESDGSTSPTGLEIPTPDRIPARKTSLIQPAASKLSPQPIHHLHHPQQNALSLLDDD